jgi:predicted DNA-binding transcriptional regulator YafY
MSYPFEVLALLLVVVSLMGMLWAMFWPKPSTRSPQTPQHWDLVYVDDDGVLLFTMVRVLDLNLDSHRLTAWCSRTGAQRVFKLSKILKATDVQSGERVRLPSSKHLNPEALVDEQGASTAPAPLRAPHKTAAHRRIEARDAEESVKADKGKAHKAHRNTFGKSTVDGRGRPHIGWA